MGEAEMTQHASMPMELVMVRHGRSRANEAQQADKRGDDMTPHSDVFDIHDYAQRLSPVGVEQAKTAREWMVANGLAPEEFDERYVSSFHRTMETAAYLGGPACQWLVDARLIERNWGHYGAMTIKERQERYPHTERMKQLSSFLVQFDGGESIYSTMYPFRDFLGTMYREKVDKRVLVVSHGERMWVARFVIERMTIDEWQRLDADKTMRIGNCALLQYRRQNPEDPEDVVTSFSSGWRRMIDPVEPEKSPYGGEWCKLPGKRHFTGQQLLAMIEGGEAVAQAQD